MLHNMKFRIRFHKTDLSFEVYYRALYSNYMVLYHLEFF